jgi:hypothetical protein
MHKKVEKRVFKVEFRPESVLENGDARKTPINR